LLAAEKLYYYQQFYDNYSNLKKTWAIIGNIINKPNRSLDNCQFDTSRGVITDEKKIAAEFNEYVSTVGGNLAKLIQDSPIHFSNFILASPCQSAVFHTTDAEYSILQMRL